MSKDSRAFADAIFERARGLRSEGLDWAHAVAQADVEFKIDNWPDSWGDNLQVLIYGDIKAPEELVEIPELGITVFPEKLKNTVIGSALCVLRALVKVDGKSVADISAAADRINTLLGLWTIVSWGNAGIGWWSHLTHSGNCSALMQLDNNELPNAVKGFQSLPPNVTRKISSALYWIRAPKSTFANSHTSDSLRRYAGYWNAFECLVDALNTLQPRRKITSTEKQTAIDQLIRERSGHLTPEDISHCYLEIINPGFRAKATHALQVCFAEDAAHYIDACFERRPTYDRLYEIRNGINHGDINTEDPIELARISARMSELWLMVLGILGRLLPVPVPAGRP